MHEEIFDDRHEAGVLLAKKLLKYKDTDAIVLSIPRGGVPIGYEISKMLNLPLDILLSKKIGHPLNPEFAIGAVSMDTVITDDHQDVSEEYIKEKTTEIRKKIKDNYEFYSPVRPFIKLTGKTVILTDDGIATGNTLLVTIGLLKKNGASKIIIAVPVLPYDRITSISELCDDLVYLLAPKYFSSIGAFYKDFDQVNDKEAFHLIREINNKNRTKH